LSKYVPFGRTNSWIFKSKKANAIAQVITPFDPENTPTHFSTLQIANEELAKVLHKPSIQAILSPTAHLINKTRKLTKKASNALNTGDVDNKENSPMNVNTNSGGKSKRKTTKKGKKAKASLINVKPSDRQVTGIVLTDPSQAVSPKKVLQPHTRALFIDIDQSLNVLYSCSVKRCTTRCPS
jgi:hypothetical protein